MQDINQVAISSTKIRTALLEVYGMMNIGNNPTVNGKEQTIETHFFNLNKSLYNKDLKIEILYRLRDEKKFKSVNMLKKQLEKDQNLALDFINKYA